MSDTIKGFDTDQTLTKADAVAFSDDGFQWVGRYISPGFQITKTEYNDMITEGLLVGFFYEVASMVEGSNGEGIANCNSWNPSALGTQTGLTAAQYAVSKMDEVLADVTSTGTKIAVFLTLDTPGCSGLSCNWGTPYAQQFVRSFLEHIAGSKYATGMMGGQEAGSTYNGVFKSNLDWGLTAYSSPDYVWASGGTSDGGYPLWQPGETGTLNGINYDLDYSANYNAFGIPVAIT